MPKSLRLISLPSISSVSPSQVPRNGVTSPVAVVGAEGASVGVGRASSTRLSSMLASSSATHSCPSPVSVAPTSKM